MDAFRGQTSPVPSYQLFSNANAPRCAANLCILANANEPQNVSIIIGRNSSRNVKEPASTPCYSQYADGLKILSPFSLRSSVFYRTQCHSNECGHCHIHLQNPWHTFFGQFAAAPCHTQIPNRLMSSRVSLQK